CAGAVLRDERRREAVASVVLGIRRRRRDRRRSAAAHRLHAPARGRLRGDLSARAPHGAASIRDAHAAGNLLRIGRGGIALAAVSREALALRIERERPGDGRRRSIRGCLDRRSHVACRRCGFRDRIRGRSRAQSALRRTSRPDRRAAGGRRRRARAGGGIAVAIATYTFLPWLRRGLSNQLTAAGAGAARASASVTLAVTSEVARTDLPAVTLQLIGPGDITAIQSQQIIRTEPRAGVTDFEPNYLAAIDFYDEDFPWRYTPVAPDPTSHHLAP